MNASSSSSAASAATAASADLVCSPSPHNVTLIYSVLMDFIASIEQAVKYEPG